MPIKQYIPISAREKTPLLQALHISPYTFVLCGSHRFGNSTPSSDWDFWTEDSPELRLLLEDLGFHNMSDAHYEDPGETVAVYRHEEQPIDICIQKSLYLNETVARLIEQQLPEYRNFTKEVRKKVLITLKAALRLHWPPTL